MPTVMIYQSRRTPELRAAAIQSVTDDRAAGSTP
jgi:hypothetical protein